MVESFRTELALAWFNRGIARISLRYLGSEIALARMAARNNKVDYSKLTVVWIKKSIGR